MKFTSALDINAGVSVIIALNNAIIFGTYMQDLTDKDIEYICKLAHLHPMDNKKKQCDDFNKLLSLFDEISGIDTSTICALTHPIDNTSQPTREDQVTETDQQTLLQQNAPKVEAGVFLVPPSIEKNRE
jgi:aspartyl-tRNA(Asn)/glutamyl-tRNA(Gln) amidotransferase subunit C